MSRHDPMVCLGQRLEYASAEVEVAEARRREGRQQAIVIMPA